ncbi:DNA-binding protein, partial [Variovorax sp. DXTD-1]|uniref:DNA-binding protein n=1 Tax=Variovorax sp. DXTD-1 TaxID=2495592 RepID=UPI000F8864D4
METLLSVEQLAAVLHKSPASIRSDASRKPASLPPICRLPETKRLLWRRPDVDAWLASFVGGKSAPSLVDSAQQLNVVSTNKRGRPTKSEQVRRARGTEVHR